jgi:hypothetical protein
MLSRPAWRLCATTLHLNPLGFIDAVDFRATLNCHVRVRQDL